MNRLFRWGIIVALFILAASAAMAFRMIFVDDASVEVPSIIGMTAEQAAGTLQSVGLTSRIDMVESDQPEGIVISQTPAMGDKTGRGRIVVVRVSKGGVRISVPDVRGMEFASAVKKLDAAGFKIGTVLRVNDSLKPSGTVIAQNPASPATVPGDRMVELLVSEGASGKNEMVQIPDLKGQSESLARQILEQSSLSVSRVITIESAQVPAGTVLRTQPIAGSRVPNGNAIILYLATEVTTPTPQPVPNISETPPNATPTSTQAPTPSAPQTASVPQAAPAAPTAPAAPASPQAPAVQPPAAQPPAAPTTVPANTPTKTAKIRYQVPPLTRPLHFKVTIEDERGMRVLQEKEARGGEYFTMDVGYTGSSTVTVELGGETVWQEKYR